MMIPAVASYRPLIAIAILVAVGIGVVCPSMGFGDERWRPVFVDAANRATWPSGEWISVPSDLVRQKLSGPLPEGFLSNAVYEAKYTPSPNNLAAADGDPATDIDVTPSSSIALLNGRLQWAADRQTGTLPTVDLGQPSIAIFDLQDDSGPSVWGLGANLRTRLVAPVGKSNHTGRWMTRGTSLSTGDAFRLSLPPALSTRIRLTVPRDFVVDAENAVVLRNRSGQDAEEFVWEIRPERVDPVVVQISPQRRAVTGVSIQCTRDIELKIDQSERTWRATLEATFVGTRPRSVPVLIPDAATVDAVFVGRESLDSIRPVTVAGQTLLRIPVPQDEKVVLQLQGRIDQRDRRSTVPDIRIPEATIVRGSASVSVLSPLEVERVSAVGYTQVLGDLDSSSGDLLEFRQVEQSCRLSVDAGPPESELTCIALTRLDASTPNPTLSRALEVSATTGSTFLIEANWPVDWVLTSVESLDGDPVVNWEVGEPTAADSLVSIRLSRPVTSTTPKRLLLKGRYALAGGLLHYDSRPAMISGGTVDHQLLVTIEGAAASLKVPSHPPIDPGKLDSDRVANSFRSLMPVRGPRVRAYDQSQRLLVEQLRHGQAASKESADNLVGSDAPQSSTPEDPEVRSESVAASLSVNAAWSSSGDPTARVVAEYRFTKTDVQLSPQIVLPKQATWIGARSGQRPIPTVGSNALRSLPTDVELDGLTVEYLVPTNSRGLRSRLRIPLPILQVGDETVPVLATTATIDLGADGAVSNVSGPVGRISELFTSNPRQRLFGPLGRSDIQPFFRPWAMSHWSRLLTGSSATANYDQSDGGRVEVFYPAQPAEIDLTVTSVHRGLAISWQLWWLALFGVTTVRFLKFRWWRHCLLLLVSLSGLAAVVVPHEFALPLGGLFAGSWFGLIVPRSVIYRRQPQRAANVDDSRYSTSIYPAVTRLVLLSIGVTAAVCVAQEPSPVREADSVVDVLIPLAETESPADWSSQVVYLRADAAADVQRSSTADGQLLRDVVASVSRSDTGLVVDCTFDVVQSPVGVGVVVPLACEAIVDASSVKVDGLPVVPLPVHGGIFVPTHPTTTRVCEVSLVLETSKPVDSPGDQLLYLLPFAQLASGSLRVSEAELAMHPASVIPEGNGLYRLLPDRRPLVAVTDQRRSTVVTPIAFGSMSSKPDGLTNLLSYTLTIPNYVAYKSLQVALPPDVDLTRQAETRQVASVPLPATSASLVEFQDLWQTLSIESGQHATSLRFEDASAELQTQIRFDARFVGDVPPEAMEPTVTLGGDVLTVDWQLQNVDGQLAGGGVPVEGDLAPGDAVPDSADQQSPKVEYRVTLMDDRLQWLAHVRADVGVEPSFAFGLDIDRRLDVSSVKVRTEGREVPNRSVVRNGTLSLLFDGAVTGPVDVEIFASLARPRRGRIALPTLALLDNDSTPLAGTCRFENASSSPANLMLPNEQVPLWEVTLEYSDWPSTGPRTMSLRPETNRVQVDTAYVSLGAGDERVFVAMSSGPMQARREVTLPEGYRAAKIDDKSIVDPGTTRPILLTTTEGTPETVLSVTPSRVSQDLEIPLPQVGRTSQASTWVVIARSDRRVPIGAQLRSLSEIPGWLANRLPRDFVGSAYSIERTAPLRLVSRPTVLGPAPVANASHVIWRCEDDSIVGMTRWPLVRPGTFQITNSPDLTIEAVLVDGKRVMPDRDERYSASRFATIWWRGRTPGQRLIVPQPESPAAKESFFTFQNFGSWRLNSSLIARLAAPTIESIDDGEGQSDDIPPADEDSPFKPIRLDSRPQEIIATSSANSLVQYDRVADAPVTQMSIAEPAISNWWTGIFVSAFVIAAALLIWKVDQEPVWQSVANSFAQHPRVVALAFGCLWWAFLVPSALGVLIMLLVAYLALFHPDAEREVRIGARV